VTCLRSPSSAAFEVRIFSARCLGVYDSGLAKRPAGAVVSAAPQDRQNFLPGVTGVPQLGQAASSRDHSPRRSARPRRSQPGIGNTSCQSLQAASPVKSERWTEGSPITLPEQGMARNDLGNFLPLY
jgi:hypothetical protein